MLRELLARLDAPVTFVVGKGGVGKTTTAGGIALALADAGTGTHLLSTDPAHSLDDLFQADSGSAPTPSPCTPRLVLESVDAASIAAERFSVLEPALRQLIDRGTYLDEADAESLLEGSLPGLDEIGAALRIVALAGSARLVIDTAPTGHTLRLLDVPDTLDAWLRVFGSMADKADTVASALVGQNIRMGAEAALDELRADLGRFADIAAGAEFVIVGGAGAVIEAETERLRSELEVRGLRVAATVAVERPGARAELLLPFHPGLSGCDRLRRWIEAEAGSARADEEPADVREPAGEASVAGEEGVAEEEQRRRIDRTTRGGDRSAPGASDPAQEFADPFRLLDRELVLFAGKGGVGKTTCAVAAAVRFARSGATILLGVDPAGSLADVLGGESPPGLDVRQVDAEREMEEFRASYRNEVERVFEAVGLDRSATMDREVVESLWGLAPPGLDEVVAVTRLASQAEDGRRIVLDTAPTGHFLRLVAMPELALDWTHRLMRILLKYRALGDLDASAGPLLRLAKRLKALRERLGDPSRTAVILVTLDEDMVRAETARLVDRLRALGIAPAAVLVNRADPSVRTTPAAAADLPVLRAPELPHLVGADRLRAFADRWERIH